MSKAPGPPPKRVSPVLVAGETPDVEAALRRAGYAVRPITFTPFDQAGKYTPGVEYYEYR